MKSEMAELGAKAVGVAAPLVVTNAQLESVLGVSGSVLLAVSAGAFCAVAWSQGQENRRQLLQVALASVVLGCAITSLLTEILRWKLEWDLQPKHVASFGVVVGWALRFIIPPFLERIPKWLDGLRIPFISKKGE